jgi:hypothetical protein
MTPGMTYGGVEIHVSLGGGEWSASHPGRFTSEWVGPTACLGTEEKSPLKHRIRSWLGPRTGPDVGEESPRFPFDRRQDGSHSRSGYRGEKRNLGPCEEVE